MTGIGIIGRPRTGKDTMAAHLIEKHGYTLVSIAEPIKEIGLAANPIIGWSHTREEPIRLTQAVEHLGWEEVKDKFPEVRRFLWAMSVDGVSKTLGEDVWTNLAVRRIRACQGPVVVTDVRLAEEAEALRAEGLTIVYLSRKGISERDERGGEHLSPIAADTFLYNHSTLGAFWTQVDALVHRLK